MRFAIGVLILWLFLQGGNVFGETISTSEYFPLDDWNAWNYRVTGPYSTYNQTVTVLPGTTMINGVATKAVKSTAGPDGEGIDYWTNDLNGVRVHAGYA